MTKVRSRQKVDNETLLQKVKGGGLRFLAVVFDFCLAFALFSFFSKFELLNDFYKEIHKAILTLNLFDKYQFLNHTLPLVCLNLTLFFIFRFWTTLIFGVSLSQFILGLRGGVSGLWDRIGGSIRVLFEFLLLPLFLFEFICIFRIRTLKEFLTYTHVVDRDPKVPIVRIVIIAPIILLIMFVSPLYNNPSIALNKEIKVLSEIKEMRVKKRKVKIPKKYYASNSYKFSSLSSLGDGRFIIFPSFDILKKGKIRTVVPFFTIYDSDSKTSGSWRVESKLDLFELFDRIKGMQPLFTKNYPNLSSALEKERKLFFIREYDSGRENKSLMDSKTLGEIQKYTEISFNLQLRTIHNHMLKWGPFLGGYVLFKEKIMDFVQPHESSRVDQVKFGNAVFLRLRQNLSEKTFLKGEWRETLINLSSPNSFIFILNWTGDFSPKKSLSDFYKEFLIPARWYFDYKELFAFPLKIQNMKPFHVADYYTKKQLPPLKRELLESYILKYAFSLAKENLLSRKTDFVLKELLAKHVQRMIDVGKLRNQKKEDYYSASFFDSLRRLKNAIIEDNKAFFKKAFDYAR
ncbi:MAG: hypothetical protein CME68_03410 [Halobacteriovoraceae bacterium]|nr:hypothetical protein [Halobacteriovoraceae bacterium]